MTPNNHPSDRINAALLTARLAAQKRHTAAAEYRASLQAAHNAGCTYSQLAATLGITRQAIRNYLLTN